MKSPGVIVPPPLIYAAFFLAGMTLDSFVPITIPTILTVRIIGWIWALLSFVIAVSAFREFFIARTTIFPNRPVSSLITRGIFRISRNPLYLSLLCLYCGAALFWSVWWALIFAPLLVAVMNGYVIAREETYLVTAFGAKYRGYCSRVRRWL